MVAAARSMLALEPRPRATFPAREDAAASPSHRPVFDIVNSVAGFEAMEPEWNDLFARSSRPTHVFQSFNFCWHWARHYLASAPDGIAGLEPSIVTARQDGRLMMVLPLATRRSPLLAQTVWMGDPVAQYGDALIDGGIDAETLLRDALQFVSRNLRTDVLWLRRVRADANIAPALQQSRAIAADRQQAPYMDLASAPDFATFEQRYTSKMRRNRRRLVRRLQDKGDVAFVRLHGGEAARTFAVEAVALKSRWLADRGLVSSAVSDERMSRLFGDLAARAERPVDSVVSALKSNGTTAAVQVSFAHKGRLAIHLIAFNLDFEKAGAGVLLLEQGLRDGYREHFSIYDMLAPADPYKGDWCQAADDVVDWAVPVGIKGRIYARVYLGIVRGRLKSILKQMPKSVRHRLGIGAARPATVAPSDDDKDAA